MRTVIPSRSAVTRGLVIAAAAGLALLVSTPAPATPPGVGGGTSRQNAPATSEGFRVELDASGAPVTPPEGTAPVTAPAATATVPAERLPLIETKTAAGGTGVVLDERFHRHVGARIEADGQVGIECVDARADGRRHDDPAPAEVAPPETTGGPDSR
jgi:hypothetical protein